MKFFETSDGLKIAYKDQGEGMPILCLSGLSRNSDDFNYLMPYLDGLRVIRMDYRGRGASDFDANYKNYNLFREGRDAIELMDHLGIEKAAIIGTSRGGLIAMVMAPKYVDRYLGVLLNDIGPVLEQDGLSHIMTELGIRPSYKTFAEAEQNWPQTQEGFSNIPPARWAQEIRHRWAQADDGLQLRYDPNLRKALEEADHGESIDLWEFFDALRPVPVAVVRAVNSNLLSEDTALEMRRRRLDLIMADVSERGHIPFLDEPAALLAVKRFLEAAHELY